MKPAVAFIVVGTLFVVGIVVGVLGTHLYYAHHLGRPGGPQEMWAHRFEARLERELELTPEQMQSIHEILDEGYRESERIRGEMAPRVHEHMRRIHERMLELLTPEQRERFEKLQQRHRRRADMFLLGPGHGPPPWGRGLHRRPPPREHEP